MKLHEVAARYIGQRELAGNVFKEDTELGKKLHAAGQKDGDPWCALFGEVCAKESMPDRFEEWDRLFSASAVQTFKNFEKAGFTISKEAVLGSVVVWQKYLNGAADWRGHLGIVSKVNNDNTFRSIEGNTNSAGSREGVEVAERPHRLAYDVQTGLRLMGFIVLS